MRETWRIRRRTVLRGTGVTLALPFLEAMMPRKTRAAGATSPQRLLLLWHPNGWPYWDPSDPNLNAPDVDSDPSRSRPPNPLAPGSVIPREIADVLSPVKEYVSYVENLSTQYYRNANCNLVGATNQVEHCGFGSFYSGLVNGSKPAKVGTTVDQMVARNAPRAKGRMLDIAINPTEEPGDDACPAIFNNTPSWRGPDDPVVPFHNPAKLFNQFFGTMTPAGQPDEATRQLELDRLRKKRLVLDVVNGDIKALAARLGKDDRQKLDQYTTGIAELDRRVVQIMAAPPGPPVCNAGKAPASIDVVDDRITYQQYVAKMEAFYDLLFRALQCDLIRVAAFMHAPVANVPYINYGFLPGVDGRGGTDWHGCSHQNDTGGGGPLNPIARDNFVVILKWHYKLVADLAARLKAEMSPTGGNMLDETLAVWGSGIGVGKTHYGGHLHQVLIGKGGGAFRTGAHVMPPAQSVMNLWLTVLNGFGLPMTKFGDDSTGPISQLLA